MSEKERLKQEQPVAWTILSNALKSHTLSHAYLIYGPKGSPKRSLGLLLAQSLFCPHPDEEGFACQSCDVCRQVAADNNADFFWLHPEGSNRKPLSRKELEVWWSQKEPQIESEDEMDVQALEAREKKEKAYRIRKDDIVNMQNAFRTSASGESGHQVYFLEQYDNATPEASNSLLKFLEEPREGITGILEAEDIGRILPTITSRAQLIRLRPSPLFRRKEEILQVLDDEAAAAMLAKAGYTPAQVLTLTEKVNLFELGDASLDFWKHASSPLALVTLQTGIFQKKKNKKEAFDKTGFRLFLQWLLYWIDLDESVEETKKLDIRLHILKTLDAMIRPVDPALLLDRLAYEMLCILTS